MPGAAGPYPRGCSGVVPDPFQIDPEQLQRRLLRVASVSASREIGYAGGEGAGSVVSVDNNLVLVHQSSLFYPSFKRWRLN